MNCPNCQTELPEDASFCLRCGNAINVETDDPPSPTWGWKKFILAFGLFLLVVKGISSAALNAGHGMPEPSASPSPTADIGHLPTPTPVIHGTLPPVNQAEMRETLRASYEAALQQANPHLNYIQAKLVKGRKGFELYGVHAYFNQYSFDVGALAGKVEGWFNTNQSQLKTAGIVRVGVKSERGGGNTGFDLK